MIMNDGGRGRPVGVRRAGVEGLAEGAVASLAGASWQTVADGAAAGVVAEGVGFEPTSRVTPTSNFQDCRHRPLGEPSCMGQPYASGKPAGARVGKADV